MRRLFRRQQHPRGIKASKANLVSIDASEAKLLRLDDRQYETSAASSTPHILESIEIRRALKTEYQYRPLHAGIRLLSFDESTTAKNQLLIHIEEFPLSMFGDLETYDAISYVWGEPNFTAAVLCDGGTSHLKITERLYNILLDLSKFSRSSDFLSKVKFWVDAICINQEDAEERSVQVQRMAKIYRRATRVHVFLGTPTLHPADCLKSEWFWRRWVVQEVTSAREVVAHCALQGSQPWASIMYSIQKHIEDQDSGTLDQHVARVVQELRELHLQGTGKSGILKLLLTFQHTRCKDDRDRLFAFFSIANDIVTTQTRYRSVDNISKAVALAQIYCRANYQFGIKEVYTEFAKAVLRSAFPIDLLHCAAAFGHGPEKNVSLHNRFLPTWVPDWRNSLLYEPLMGANKFRAGFSNDNKKAIVKVDPPDGTISVGGIHVGMVSQVMTKYPESIECAVSVEYIRSGCLDMSINRVGFSFTGPLGANVIGCAPSNIEVGDEVIIFVGGRTPFILRPRTFDTFELIADCYVPELMNGEVFELRSGLKNFILV